MKHSISFKNNHPTLLNILAIAFWILIWEALAVLIGSELIIASPVQVAKRLLSMIVDISVWKSLGFSLIRISLGFISALILGAFAAVLSAKFKAVKTLLSPITAVIKSTPVASFIILAIIWFGSRNLSVFISFLMVFPVIYLNLLSGAGSMDKGLDEMAAVYKISPAKRFKYIYTVQIMPFLISACSLGLGLCWKSGVAAEVIGISTGSIGERLYKAKLYFETSDLLAWTVIIIAVSVSIEKLVMTLLKSIQKRIQGSYSKEYVDKTSTDEASGVNAFDVDASVLNAIELKGIKKAYGEQSVIDNLSLIIPQGGKISVLGRSGAGKTTLLRLIAGLERPDSGEVSFDSNIRFGVVFQEDRLIDGLNPIANIAIAGGKIPQAAVSLLKSFKLTEDIIYKPCCELSGGEKRRVAIARALLSGADVIIMDEPFKGIDHDTLYEAVLPSVKACVRDKTLILVTHDEKEAEYLCDKRLVLG